MVSSIVAAGLACAARAKLALRRAGDRRGVTSVEYAIIAGIMVIALVVSVPVIGKELAPIFNNVSTSL